MKKVLLLLANGFETYEASVFIDVIGWNLIDGDGTTQLESCGFTREVKSSFGQCMIVDHIIEDVVVDDYDALAIPGGFEEYDYYDEAYDEQFSNVIREFQIQGKIIASVCVGSLAIGKSGVLTGRQGTTYSLKPKRQEDLMLFDVDVINEPIVVDDNIITSWDPSTGIDVALMLLERLTSTKNADHIREIMGFDRKYKQLKKGSN
jgi:4-methyl-5(b-hydroxyethyl)-thiazole monophosphate biosynthesis